MTPIMRRILLNNGLVTRGLVSLFDFMQGANADVLYNKRGVNNGVLGSAVGADTNDPTWTTTGLQCDGTDNYVSFPSILLPVSSDVTLISVFQALGAAGGGYHGLFAALSKGDGNNPRVLHNGSTGMLVQIRDSENIVLTTPTVGTTKPHFFAARTKGSVGNAFCDTLKSADTVITPGFVVTAGTNGRIGQGAPFNNTYFANGIFYYSLIYNRGLSDAEIKQVRKYLQTQLATRGISL